MVKNVKFFVLRFFHASFFLETKNHGRDPIRLQLRADRQKKNRFCVCSEHVKIPAEFQKLQSNVQAAIFVKMP